MDCFTLQDSNMPRDVNAAAQMCCSMLSNPNTRPLVVIVDALNQVRVEVGDKVLTRLVKIDSIVDDKLDLHGLLICI